VNPCRSFETAANGSGEYKSTEGVHDGKKCLFSGSGFYASSGKDRRPIGIEFLQPETVLYREL
jgi:hypothetical protein